MARGKLWSKKEIELLKRKYDHIKDKDLIRTIGRSLSSIRNKSFELKLKKDKEFFSKARRRLSFEIKKERLFDLYVKQKKSIRKTAKIIGISKNTVSYYLEKFSIRRRTKSESNKERFKREDVWCKGLSKATDKRLKLMGKKVTETYRKQREEKLKKIEQKLNKKIPELLNHLYWDKKLTQEKIAKKLCLDRGLIIDLMKQHNIQLRLNYEHILTLRGKKHPLYGKTWEDIYGEEGAKERRKFFSKFSREMIIKRIENKEFPFFDTAIEKAIAKEMCKRNIPFISQFNVDNKFVCDFAIPSVNLIVECDGDYWHANPKKYDRKNKHKLHPIQRDNLRRDIAKDDYLYKKGWTVIRFFESEIKENVSECVDIISASIKSNI